MKNISITKLNNDKVVSVHIYDPTRPKELDETFYCPLSCIGDVVRTNLEINV